MGKKIRPGRHKKTKADIRKQKEKIFTEIRPYLQVGYSLHKSCLFAQTSYTQALIYYDNDPIFCDKIDRERLIVNTVARKNVVAAIQKGEITTSWDWLRTQEKKDFSTRQEIEVEDKGTNEKLDKVAEIITNLSKYARQSIAKGNKNPSKRI